MICEHCGKEFKRIDLHKCNMDKTVKTIVKNIDSPITNILKKEIERNDLQTDIQNANNVSKTWAYYGMEYMLFYFWTTNFGVNLEILKLKNCKPEVFLDDRDEGFRLDEVALISKGIPIFCVRRGYPISISFEFLTNEERGSIIKEHPITSDEFYSKMKSSYKNQVYKNSIIYKEFIAILICAIALSVLITVVVFMSIGLTPVIETVYVYNETIGIYNAEVLKCLI